MAVAQAELFPSIAGFNADDGKKEMREVGIEWLVVDSAAGTRGEALRDAVRRADAMVVPVSPSVFDMAATADFLKAVGEYKSVRDGGLAVGLVAMRVDSRTRAAGELDEFLKQFAAKGRPEPRAPSGGGREAPSGAQFSGEGPPRAAGPQWGRARSAFGGTIFSGEGPPRAAGPQWGRARSAFGGDLRFSRGHAPARYAGVRVLRPRRLFGVRPAALARRAGLGAVATADAVAGEARRREVRMMRCG